ncbi:uncharacterized protein LOC131030636 [Cryptomeria japonica]|uniref:uncharacterized protein LOC131030636 n=1 Tax=Cryptomeria japonica TaxID=3369 RepID=UPI0027D9CF49|nr:uncharacterized protein LOC131030636 [Cryptomeria japonica]
MRLSYLETAVPIRSSLQSLRILQSIAESCRFSPQFSTTMLLRSSSAPTLGSLIPHPDNIRETIGKAITLSENANRFCFQSTHSRLHSRYNTCPADNEKEANSLSNLRRVQSEGDLESLVNRESSVPAKDSTEMFDDFNLASLNKPWSRKLSAKRLPSLKSNASLSWYCNEKKEADQYEILKSEVDGLESNMQEFSFGNEDMRKFSVTNLATSGNEEDMVMAEPMFMALGPGFGVMKPSTDMGSGSGHGNSTPKENPNGSGGDEYDAGSEDIESYYQRMLVVNPVNSLILRNYAQFLYETKNDYHKAEEFYSKAILTQPADGNVLAQYAKLMWELHGDEERASICFEEAVRASPADSNVLAAYASFLWNTSGDQEDNMQEHSSFSSYPDVYKIVGSATNRVPYHTRGRNAEIDNFHWTELRHEMSRDVMFAARLPRWNERIERDKNLRERNPSVEDSSRSLREGFVKNLAADFFKFKRLLQLAFIYHVISEARQNCFLLFTFDDDISVFLYPLDCFNPAQTCGIFKNSFALLGLIFAFISSDYAVLFTFFFSSSSYGACFVWCCQPQTKSCIFSRAEFEFSTTMLLRSSSTPILGSLTLHSDNNRENVGKANSLTENANRFGFRGTNSHTHYETCSVDEEKEVNSMSNFRRVHSDGSLENLIGNGCPVQEKLAADTFLQCDSFDDFNLISSNKPWPRRLSAHKRLPSLKSIASLSWYCKEEDEFNQDESLEISADASESSMQEFSFGNERMRESNLKGLAISENEQDMVSAKPMFMARGLGIDIIEPSTDVGGGHGNSTPKETSLGGSGGGGGEDGYGGGSENIEEYYQKMLEGNPANSLILRNYAQFLYETKHDYLKAEEYYSRAILVQPGDGEVLARYAKLIWELHGDEERASAYFEQAVQASPADCHVLAAYASFLWNSNTDGEEEEKEQEPSNFSCNPHSHGIVGSATATVA